MAVTMEPPSGQAPTLGSGPEMGVAVRVRAACILICLVAATGIVLVLVALVARDFPTFASPSILAFTFGLRHAVDADHIAAIDNVSRKLISEGQQPLCVGLFFSIGHCSVVVLLCAGVAAGSSYLRGHLGSIEDVGAIVGTVVSASVLLLVALINLRIAWQLYGQWRSALSTRSSTAAAAAGEGEATATVGYIADNHDRPDLPGYHTHLVTVDGEATVSLRPRQGGADQSMAGPLSSCSCCMRMFSAVDASWKMLPVGFLFGLGFDTASEVGLLALTAMGGRQGVPPVVVMLLPLAFAAGMTLVDTLDGMLMLWAYSWAMLHPARRLGFNFYLTSISALLALLVAAVEVLGCLQSELQLSGGMWEAVRQINEHFEYVGYSIMALFATSTLAAVLLLNHCPAPGAAEEPRGSSAAVEDTAAARRAPPSVLPAPVAAPAGDAPTAPAPSGTDDYLKRRLLAMATSQAPVQARDI